MPTFLQSVFVRWLIAIIAFPLGGLVGHAVAGPADTLVSALISGLLAGAVIGVGQAMALGLGAPSIIRWTVATAAGLGVGLAVMVAINGQAASTSDVVLNGAVAGVLIGLGQATILGRGPAAAIWVVTSAVAWAAGWFVSASIGVDLTPGWPVFGGPGAITSQLITGVIIWRLIAMRMAMVGRA